MPQNIVIPSKDNLVVLSFSGVDLTLATDIKVNFGTENYTLLLDPTIVTVDTATQLSLDLSATNEVGKIYVVVTYFDVNSVNGTDITSRELNNLNQIVVSIGSQLIIEDGSIVLNANSYASDIELKAYADKRGLSLPATQPEREALLLMAMDFIDSLEDDFQGHRVNNLQVLAFPRFNVFINNFFVNSNVIPQELKDAQIEAAVAANTLSLLTNETAQNVQSEKVDALSRSYFSNGKFTRVRLDRVYAKLNKIMLDTNVLTRA